MKRYLDQFNQLKPQERRFVVAIFLFTFVALNYFFVLPYYGELGRQSARMEKAEKLLAKYLAEIARKDTYTKAINTLTTSEHDVPAEDQEVHFDSTYRDHAVANKVLVLSSSPPHSSTNDFFINHEVGVQAQAGEKELVDFLYSLGSGDSLMRVKSITLRPDPSHQQLSANITIVASYKRTKPGPVPAALPPQAKPAAPPPQPKAQKAAAPAKVDKAKAPPVKAAPNNRPPAGGKGNSVTNRPPLPNFIKRQ
jgi:hypothetical protein